eukprot:COSAG05_NODE_136_length_16902_cov_21.052312_15_plen_84_part_00
MIARPHLKGVVDVPVVRPLHGSTEDSLILYSCIPLLIYRSQGGLDGVNAFHCRSCYMYSGTGTYSTAVQVPVPQLYGFLTVYF